MQPTISKIAQRAITEPFLVIDNFLPSDFAAAVRSDIDAHFANPSAHAADSHQIWNYWYVPGQYTYLRTRPEKIMQSGRAERLVELLRAWSAATLGLGRVTWPYLSMYVDGCGQGLHNDSKNGRFAFVLSLSRPDRRALGGRTIVMREGDLFRRNLQTANAGTGLHDLIEPEFNRLLVFDDRLIHGVENVTGTMDPADGRFVFHGHIEEAGPIIAGSLAIEALRDGIQTATDQFVTRHSAAISLYHGPLVIRFKVTKAGTVADAYVLLDRVIHEHDGNIEWTPIRNSLIEALSRTSFPGSTGETDVTLPVMFGGPLRQ